MNKVHYQWSVRNGPECGIGLLDIYWSNGSEDVTCKNCVRILKSRRIYHRRKGATSSRLLEER